MREFTTKCIDNQTGYEMVLSECSYNMACNWIFGIYNPQDICAKTDCDIIYITLLRDGIKFAYDEDRGYLMRT